MENQTYTTKDIQKHQSTRVEQLEAHAGGWFHEPLVYSRVKHDERERLLFNLGRGSYDVEPKIAKLLIASERLNLPGVNPFLFGFSKIYIPEKREWIFYKND